MDQVVRVALLGRDMKALCRFSAIRTRSLYRKIDGEFGGRSMKWHGSVAMSIIILLATMSVATAESISFACDGVWAPPTAKKLVSTEFSITLDSATNALTGYSMFGTARIPKPKETLVGELDEDGMLAFSYEDDAPGWVHVLGLEKITGQFRHFLMEEGGALASTKILVRGKCRRVAPLW